MKLLGLLPRPVARWVGASFASVAYAFRTPLRRAAMFNLHLAFPDWSEAKRKSIIRGMIRQIGWMAANFHNFREYTSQNIEQIVVIGWIREFRRRATPRKRRAVSDRPHERLGAVIFRARSLRTSSAFSACDPFPIRAWML